MNLFLKLVELRSRVEGFYKDTKSFGYSYVSGGQILDKINPIMNELKLLFLPKSAVHRGWVKHEYVNKKNEEMLDFIVDGELVYVWVNAENPEETWIIDWQYYGAQNDISKAFGSALTYSERYLLLKSLGLPTDEEDPDSRDTNGRTTKKAQTVQKNDKPTYKEFTQPNTKSPAEMVKENNNKYYKTILSTLVSNISNNEFDTPTKFEIAKRILNSYIIKDLKLSYDKIEFVSQNGTKLIPTNIEVLIGETIDNCAKKIEEELAIIDSAQEEVI